MKKFVSILMVLISSALSYGQKMSDTEIANMISMSAEFNQKVVNPDLIFPGQILTYMFQDGTKHQIVVEKGDSQWTIVRDKLSRLIKEHGSLVKPEPPVKSGSEEISEKGAAWGISFWWILLIALFLLVFLYKLAKNLIEQSNSKKPRKDVDPTTAGKPVVVGGVNSISEAERHFRNLYPGQNVLIKDIKPGFISTPQGKTARVGFANGVHQNLSFRNVAGFKGKVSTDNGQTWRTEYFLQACGNPAKARNSFLTGIIFSESPINLGDESQAPVVPEPATPVVSELIQPTPTNEADDIAIVSGDQAVVAEEFLKTQEAHKVTMVYVRWADGRVKVKSIFETKNASNSKAGQKPSEKKE